MKVRMFLFSKYGDPQSVEGNTLTLFQFLRDQGVELIEVRWNGQLNSLPTDELVMIRRSSHQYCTDVELTRRCEKFGHFLFYHDSTFIAGKWSTVGMLGAATRFLETVRSCQPVT